MRAGRLLERARTSLRDRSRWHLLSLTLLAVLLGLVLATFRDYGITYDEAVQHRYGNRLVRWYATMGSDTAALWQNDLYYYGGLFELCAQAARRVSPLGTFDTRHLVNALFGLLGVLAAWGLGSRLAGPAAGFASALVLALTPRFYGDWFANPKDLPFASLFVLAAWAMVAAAQQLPRLRWRGVIATGIAIGLACGVRAAGMALYAYAALLWLGLLWFGSRTPAADDAAGDPSARAVGKGDVAHVAGRWLVVVAIGWTLMLAVWPWALVKPLRHPFQALAKLSHFWDTVTILFDGRLVLARDLPRDYVPRWLALSLPEVYAVAFVLGAVGLVRLLRARRLPARRAFVHAWTASLALLPVGWIVLRHTPLYNGLRHVLFVLPILAVLAGVAITAFFRSRPPGLAVAAAGLLLAATAALTVVDMVELHPYEYVYFNRLVAGGLPAAAARFEGDYWCASFKEGAGWLVSAYRPQSEGPIRVRGTCSDEQLLEYLNGPAARRFVPGRWQQPDVVLASTALGPDRRPPGRVVHVVERQGAPLLLVIEPSATR